MWLGVTRMKSVKENESILIIKNSKFITQIYKIDTEEKVKEYLELAKEKYPNATHYCYGYILDNITNKFKCPLKKCQIYLFQLHH